MTINYEIPDEKFNTFICALNNALVSLNSTYAGCKFGTDVPKAFEKLQDKPLEELEPLISERLDSLVDFYEYLLKIEKEMTL